MPFRTVYNGCKMVRRQIATPRTAVDRPLERIKVEAQPVAKEGTESSQAGAGIKAPTEAEKKAQKDKLRAELFRAL